MDWPEKSLHMIPTEHIWNQMVIHGLYSLSGKTSYRKISWSLEAARFGFKLFQSLWNLARTSAALLPRCLSNFRAIRPLQHTISRLWDFTRFGGKTSYRLVNRGPESWHEQPSYNTTTIAWWLMAVWDALRPERLTSLERSMLWRVRAVQDARGGHTRYQSYPQWKWKISK